MIKYVYVLITALALTACANNQMNTDNGIEAGSKAAESTEAEENLDKSNMETVETVEEAEAEANSTNISPETKSVIDYFFNDYEVLSSTKTNKSNEYTSEMWFRIKVKEAEFAIEPLEYKGNTYLYVQANNATNIDIPIPDPKDYIKKDIKTIEKTWQRYDLSQSYLLSMEDNESLNQDMDYLITILP